MPFREVDYKASCIACAELADHVCGLCEGPVCTDHRDSDMCLDCRAGLDYRLSRAGLGPEDLAFKPVLDDTATPAEQDAWEAHTQRAYEARFIMSRFRRERSRSK